MSPFYIETVGAITSLGHTAKRTVAGLRAGMDGFRLVPFEGTSEFELQAAPIEGYAEGLLGISRYCALAAKALEPCLADLTPNQRERTVVFLGLPLPMRPGIPKQLATALEQNIRATFSLPSNAIVPVPLGRASTFRSIEEATSMSQQGDIDHFIVGGVDTLVNGDSLSKLSTLGLLKEDWDGFIPGEAAAFLRLRTHKPKIGCWGGSHAVEIGGVGMSTEDADGSANQPLVGVGLRHAYKKAMDNAGAKEEDIELCINDVNGARSAFEDEGYAWTRFFRKEREYMEVWHIASYLGETGAAAGAIELIWGSAALELGFCPGSGILASASEDKLRTAAFLKIPQPYPPTLVNDRFQIGTQVPVIHYSSLVDDELREEKNDIANDPGMRIPEIDHFLKDTLWLHFNELDWLIELRQQHHRANEDPWADIEEFEVRLLEHLDAIAWAGKNAQEIAIDFIASSEVYEAAAGMMALLSWPLSKQTQAHIVNAIVDSPSPPTLIKLISYMPKQTSKPVLLDLLKTDCPQIKQATLLSLFKSSWLSEEQLDQLIGNLPDTLLPLAIEAIGSNGFSNLWPSISALLAQNHFDSQLLTEQSVFSLLTIGRKQVAIRKQIQPLLQDMPPIPIALKSLRDGTSYWNNISNQKSHLPEVLEAIGWAGESAAKEALLTYLEDGDDDQKQASANALYRIFGCPLFEEVQVVDEEDEMQDEEIDHDEPTDTIEIKKLSQNKQKWETALIEFENQIGIKLRHGKEWSPKSAIEHLHRDEGTFRERVIAAWEYAIVNNAPLPVKPWQFVASQKSDLNLPLQSVSPIYKKNRYE